MTNLLFKIGILCMPRYFFGISICTHGIYVCVYLSICLNLTMHMHAFCLNVSETT